VYAVLPNDSIAAAVVQFAVGLALGRPVAEPDFRSPQALVV
jgi:hypothetical protein